MREALILFGVALALFVGAVVFEGLFPRGYLASMFRTTGSAFIVISGIYLVRHQRAKKSREASDVRTNDRRR
jgi:high-affinity Fe2+/Pb2+ permease